MADAFTGSRLIFVGRITGIGHLDLGAAGQMYLPDITCKEVRRLHGIGEIPPSLTTVMRSFPEEKKELGPEVGNTYIIFTWAEEPTRILKLLPADDDSFSAVIKAIPKK